MKNLFLLFIKHSGFVVFMSLEIFSFYLIITNNQKQRDIFFNTAENFTNFLDKKYKYIVNFFDVSKYADKLSLENSKLQRQLENAKTEKSFISDTTYNKVFEQKYIFTSAKIINNSINKHYNQITLDKGTNHGVKKHSAVIDGQGIIGIVTDVSGNFAKVMSILNENIKISASIKRNNYFGSLFWDSTDPKHMTLENIPKHADVILGDTIITSGYSKMFPGGIIIGVVKDFEIKQGSNFYTIDVLLSNDLSNARYVYVVTNLFREEQDKLETNNDG